MFCISWNDCVNSLDFWNLPAKADFFAGFWNLPEKVRFFFCCDVCFLELLMMGSSVRVDFLSLVFFMVLDLSNLLVFRKSINPSVILLWKEQRIYGFVLVG